ncbi:helix-turn-helix transcriptional regulator [Actinophytocola oryzae]|uniref:Putative DNA-binding transcriptional regulator YafY n=1 Tax=Actinophytocola oryzae TaxID=502181 RepID=A0A4R7VRV4_9PSEU|nr:YafY family protein [Actinophytocola oryzae]TDV52195.1 putative DNA-binding transcriptional regulator YafY [Actinophytocola oryzae]
MSVLLVRASRIVQLLLLLQTRGRLTAAQLAAELEVSVRTVYRDVDALHAAGVPLYGEAGHAGGYRLVEGYRTRLTGLTENEADSLFLTGLPGPAHDLGLGAEVAAAWLKLTASLPPELRDRATRIQQRFHLDAPGWYAEPDDTPALVAAADAVWRERRIHIEYHRWRAPSEVTRTVDPYGLVLKAGRWYLVGASRRISTYRVSQIRTLTVLDEGFQRPAGFDLGAYWESYLADFDARRHTDTSTVRISPELRKRLVETVEPSIHRAVEETASAPDDDGWVTAVVPIEQPDHALRLFLGFGADIEVLAPDWLRQRITASVAALARTYSPD